MWYRMSKEYLAMYWEHAFEKEPSILLYEVDLEEDRYATRMINVHANGRVNCLEDKNFRFITEAPVPSIEEINADEYGSEFHANLITKEEFERTWDTLIYYYTR